MEQHPVFLPGWPRFQMSVRGSVVLIQGLRGFFQLLETKAVMLGLRPIWNEATIASPHIISSQSLTRGPLYAVGDTESVVI